MVCSSWVDGRVVPIDEPSKNGAIDERHLQQVDDDRGAAVEGSFQFIAETGVRRQIVLAAERQHPCALHAIDDHLSNVHETTSQKAEKDQPKIERRPSRIGRYGAARRARLPAPIRCLASEAHLDSRALIYGAEFEAAERRH
jgi:hypothetical protein